MYESTSEIENIRIVYQQACENMRYQDELRWSRFRTISIIEGAILLALYQFELKPIESFIIVLFGSLLVLMVSLLAIKDGWDAVAYYLRSVELEKTMGVSPINFKWLLGEIRGKHIFFIALALINLLDVLVLIKYWP